VMRHTECNKLMRHTESNKVMRHMNVTSNAAACCCACDQILTVPLRMAVGPMKRARAGLPACLLVWLRQSTQRDEFKSCTTLQNKLYHFPFTCGFCRVGLFELSFLL
jgi:hypothetical protein